ncbi:hypothetical protein [Candidatus Phytoplasma tritici]|uniref:hypothetical protein n=1 Tax=Candidatus Phytoplasma tritici TaxID=321961 RepID=UPI00040B473D|nr:hypothetical protein [Candidatus Phytoplasma tritici]
MLLNGVPIAAQGLLVLFSRHLWWPSKFPTMHQTHTELIVIVLNSASNIAVILMQTIKFVDKVQVEASQSLDD